MTLQGLVGLPSDLPARVLRRLQVLRARALCRVGLLELNPGKVDIAEDFHHPVDQDQRSALTAAYGELFPDSLGAELEEADRLAAHRFAFLGHAMNHGEAIAWSRDPVSRRDWPRAFSPDIAYRGPDRLGDIKLPWELNKHQYFFTLGKAAWLKDDPALSIEIVRQIDSWIEDNPYGRGIHWISALEAGTRAVSWIMAYPFYGDHCDGRFRSRLARSLAQHMLFVERHLSTGRFANTHLIGEATALVAGGLFLDSPRARKWLEQGLKLLEQEIERQVTPDGVHVERSIAYHRFFLDHYYLLTRLLAANGRVVPAGVLQGMERMTAFLMDVIFPDGSAPTFGDGDDARGLWFRADCPSDFRALLALGAVLFDRGDFKESAGSLPEEVLWLLGLEGVARFQSLEPRQPDHGSAAYPQGGYYALRGGWGASDPVLIFDCGPLGHGTAGHGHADALSFQLYAGGYPFLVDSGTFSYNLDYQWRDTFRSTRSHNTLVVDGEDQSVPGDRMSWQSMATAHCRRWLSTKWFDLVDGEHDGYLRLPDPVHCRRVVLFLKPDTWCIWDDLDGEDRHELEALLHLQPDCSVEIKEQSEVVLRSPDGAQLHAWFQAQSEVATPEHIIGSAKERLAWSSPGYGTRVPAQAVRIRQAFAGHTALLTFLSTSHDTVPRTLEPCQLVPVRVGRGEGIEQVFFYRIRADWPSGYKNIHFDGQLLYLHGERGEVGTTQGLWAGEFRNLSVVDLIELHSPTPIESLVLESGRCEVEIPPDRVSDLRISLTERTRLVINGDPVIPKSVQYAPKVPT